MAIKYLDNNGTTAGFGTLTATWSSTAPIWSDSAAGTDVPAAYTFTAEDTAAFGAGSTSVTAGAVTIASGFAPTLNRLESASGLGAQQLITGASATSSKLVLASRADGSKPTVALNNSSGLGINVILEGTTGFTKSGPGRLTIGKATTITGQIDVTGGSGGGAALSVGTYNNYDVALADYNVFPGNGTSVPTINVSAADDWCTFTAVRTNGSVPVTLPNSFTGEGVLCLRDSATSNGTLINAVLAGDLSGLTGTTAPNTTSTTYVRSGLFFSCSNGNSQVITLNTSLPAAITYQVPLSGTFTVKYGGSQVAPSLARIWVLGLASNPVTRQIAFEANQTSGGALDISQGIASVKGQSGYSPTLTLGGTSTLSNTVSGVIEDGGYGASGMTLALVKDQAGRWVFSGNNTFRGGLTVSAGYLGIRHSNALGNATTGAVTVSSGATLEVGGSINVSKTAAITVSGTGVSGAGAIRCTDGNNKFLGKITLGGNTTIQVNTGATLTLAGGVDYVNAAYTLTKIGGGDLIIVSATPTATAVAAPTVVSGGTVTILTGEGKPVPGAITVGPSGSISAKDDGSHYRANMPGVLTMQAGSQFTFGPKAE